ncbi:MAG: hypothetical protein ACREDE_04925, partial [Thermoplasmata archaeon]
MPPVRLDEASFLTEVERIVAAAESRGIPLRALGGVGIYYRVRSDPVARAVYLHLHGPDHGGAPRFKDLDLASLEKSSSGIYKLFVKELRFSEDVETNALFGMYRNIYFHPHFVIDIFYDVLRFSHRIPLAGRFPPGLTLSPEDLFLGKAQIHRITGPDLVDLAALLTALPLDNMDRAYLTRLLGDDWGLWYDVRTNVEGVVRMLQDWKPEERRLTRAEIDRARARANAGIE